MHEQITREQEAAQTAAVAGARSVMAEM